MSGFLCSICGKPLADGEPRYRRPDGDVHAACFKGPRVLVVDDDPFLSALVVRAVRRGRFCTVDEVSSGSQALERLRDHVYDLILSDLRMPEMDGPTFYRTMRAEHPDLVDRIVFMTSQVAHYDQFIRDTGAPLLSKPFAKEDLDAVLAHMLDPARLRREAR